jgi:phosphinothricin acetyltransferase
MNIRVATEKDVAAILDIFNEALVHTTAVYSYEPATYDEQLTWFKHKQDDGIPVFVAEDEHTLLGYITYGQFRPRPAYRYAMELSIYVDQRARNQGVGQALMEVILDHTEKAGIKTLICGIDSENKASIALCTKFGFRHSGTLNNVGYKFGNWLDLAFYQLDLKGPDHPIEK